MCECAAFSRLFSPCQFPQGLLCSLLCFTAVTPSSLQLQPLASGVSRQLLPNQPVNAFGTANSRPCRQPARHLHCWPLQSGSISDVTVQLGRCGLVLQASRVKCRSHLSIAGVLEGCEFTGAAFEGMGAHVIQPQQVSVTQQSSSPHQGTAQTLASIASAEDQLDLPMQQATSSFRPAACMPGVKASAWEKWERER